MKYISVVYILWLAIRIAISKPADDSGEKSASFIKGLLLQFASIEIYPFGIVTLTDHIMDYSISSSALLAAELTIAATGTIATLTWIGLEILLRMMYQKYYRPIGIVLVLTLLECTYSMLK